MSNKKKKKNKPEAPVKAQKVRKPMDPETKDRLITGFKTLISNDACIRAGREFRGIGLNILAVGIALGACLIADVPGLVTNLNVNYGESLLSVPYSLDQNLTNFTKAMQKHGCSVEIKDGKVAVETTSWNAMIAETNVRPAGVTPFLSEYDWYSEYSSSREEIAFEVFINNYVTPVEDSLFFARIADGKEPSTGKPRKDIDWSKTTYYAANYLAIGKESLVFCRHNTAGSGATLPGEYEGLNGVNFNLMGGEVAVGKLDALIDDKTGVNISEGEKIARVTSAYKEITVKATEPMKLRNSFSQAGIFLAVYVGFNLLFGFVLWLMTRGKQNPYRIFNLWDTQKIAYWSSLAPALLTLAGGFLLTQYATMIFIFLFGIRIMWMAMKALSPTQA